MSKIQTRFVIFFKIPSLTLFFIWLGKTRSISVKPGRVPMDQAEIAIPIEMTTKKPSSQTN